MIWSDYSFQVLSLATVDDVTCSIQLLLSAADYSWYLPSPVCITILGHMPTVTNRARYVLSLSLAPVISPYLPTISISFPNIW